MKVVIKIDQKEAERRDTPMAGHIIGLELLNSSAPQIMVPNHDRPHEADHEESKIRIVAPALNDHRIA